MGRWPRTAARQLSSPNDRTAPPSPNYLATSVVQSRWRTAKLRSAVRPELDSAYVEPGSELERQLAGIRQEVLEIDGIGIHDNFCDLGGDSLAATRIVAQIVHQLRLDLPLRSLFQSPTIAEMAAVITANRGECLGEKNLRRLLAELESLPDDEAQRRLAVARSTTVDK